MGRRIEVDPGNPSQVVISSSRASAVVALAVVVGFFALWYSALFSDCASIEQARRKLAEQPILWLFAGFPVTFLPAVVALLGRIGPGDRLVIDNLRASISRNGGLVAAFHDVTEIEIRESERPGTPRSLVLRLRDGRELPIVSGDDADRLRALADPIASVSRAPIRAVASERVSPASRRDRGRWRRR